MDVSNMFRKDYGRNPTKKELDEPDCTMYSSYVRNEVDYFVFHIKGRPISWWMMNGRKPITKIVLSDDEKYVIDSFIENFVQEKKKNQ